MRKLVPLIIGATLAFAPLAEAQQWYPNDVQSYGGLWRYQKRDWSTPWRPLNPGVCWQWSAYAGNWVWVC
ncbi:hypothetical protein [Methylocystis sp.]|uniref:hypothetical protein n=1 Tax=Methylocystis sp. TaxID=1911079 RepID=UPI003DA31BA4